MKEDGRQPPVLFYKTATIAIFSPTELVTVKNRSPNFLPNFPNDHPV